MSAGELTVAEMVRTIPCHTPACSLAELWRIGHCYRIICQRCHGAFAAFDHEIKGEPAPWETHDNP